MKDAGRFAVSYRKLTSALLLVLITSVWIVWPLQLSSAAIQRLNYTALGDSIAFGLYAPLGQGYVPLYADSIRSSLSLPVTLSPLAIPGWTSGDLLNAVRGNFVFRFSIYLSEVVTWNIGGNDLRAARSQYKGRTCGGSDNQECLRTAVAQFKANWNGIMAEIFALRRFRPTIIRTMDIYNPYVNEDQASDTWPADGGNDFQVLNAYLNQVNEHIAVTSTANHIRFAPVHLWFNGSAGTIDPANLGLLAFDGFHPGPAGHALIAILLAQQGYVPVIP
jgi:lysophospholipase L1-like esterase